MQLMTLMTLTHKDRILFDIWGRFLCPVRGWFYWFLVKVVHFREGTRFGGFLRMQKWCKIHGTFDINHHETWRVCGHYTDVQVPLRYGFYSVFRHDIPSFHQHFGCFFGGPLFAVTDLLHLLRYGAQRLGFCCTSVALVLLVEKQPKIKSIFSWLQQKEKLSEFHFSWLAKMDWIKFDWAKMSSSIPCTKIQGSLFGEGSITPQYSKSQEWNHFWSENFWMKWANIIGSTCTDPPGSDLTRMMSTPKQKFRPSLGEPSPWYLPIGATLELFPFKKVAVKDEVCGKWVKITFKSLGHPGWTVCVPNLLVLHPCASWWRDQGGQSRNYEF